MLCFLYFSTSRSRGKTRRLYIAWTSHIRRGSQISSLLKHLWPCLGRWPTGDETESDLQNLCCDEAWTLLFRYVLGLLSCVWNGTGFQARWQAHRTRETLPVPAHACGSQRLICSVLTNWKEVENPYILIPFCWEMGKWIQFDNDIRAVRASVMILSHYGTSVPVTDLESRQIGRLLLESEEISQKSVKCSWAIFI